MNEDDYTIVNTFGAEYRGLVNYYLLAGSVHRLSRVPWVMETALLKTLACKHDSSVSKMAARYKAKIETPAAIRTCFEARVESNGRKPLVARFGGQPLRKKRNAVLVDRQQPDLAGEWTARRPPYGTHSAGSWRDAIGRRMAAVKPSAGAVSGPSGRPRRPSVPWRECDVHVSSRLVDELILHRHSNVKRRVGTAFLIGFGVLMTVAGLVRALQGGREALLSVPAFVMGLARWRSHCS